MNNPLHFGLVGHNIEYSLSPRIFDAIGNLDKQPSTYKLFSVSTEDLGRIVKELRKQELNGLSVTVPYKEMIAKHCDRLSESGKAIGAVNSIWLDGNEIVGDNTDIAGIEATLNPHADLLSGKEAMIVGNGGSALATAWVLVRRFGIARLTVAGRLSSKLHECCERIRTFDHTLEITPIVSSLAPNTPIEIPSIVINCTPLGGFNHPDHVFSYDSGSPALYFDLNYNPENKNVLATRGAGSVALDGSFMLVVQAIASYQLWTGHKLDTQPVYDAIFGTRSHS